MDNRRRTLNDNISTIPIDYYIILNTCFIDVPQKLPSSQINLHCLSAEISKQQRYRSILHVQALST
jgi:hypothetical protein